MAAQYFSHNRKAETVSEFACVQMVQETSCASFLPSGVKLSVHVLFSEKYL